MTREFYEEHGRHLVVKWGEVESNLTNYGDSTYSAKYFLSIGTGSGVEILRSEAFDPTFARFFSVSDIWPQYPNNSKGGHIKVNNMDKCYTWNHMSESKSFNIFSIE